MISNVPPWIKKTSALNPEDLAHHSRAVHDPPGFDPSYLITSNFDQILQGGLFRGKPNNRNHGELFEICFWNALIAYGVDAARIEGHKDITNGKHAEIDLLVRTPMGDVALLLKTSLRERWKQCDRDANAIRHASALPPETWTVFYREKRDDTAEKMIKHAEKTERQFFTGGVKVRTVLDANAMRMLFVRCGAVANSMNEEVA